jgi:ComF family protein
MLDLVFAPVCLACGDPVPAGADERLVCGVCWSRCRPLPAPRCARCWNPVDPHREPSPVCRVCREWPAGVRAIRSAFALGDVPRALAHALKYGGWSAAAEGMAARMAGMELPRDTASEARLVVPVPTSRTRLRERGYNQAALLAEGYARRTGRLYDPDLLHRVRATASQTSLHPGDRRANVARAFAAPDAGAAKALLGEHVILVDDVWTTGATALACADALREAGARAVSVVTFARAVPELKRS